MRITIETDEKQPAPVVNTVSERGTMSASLTSTAIFAGGPPDALLQALGEKPAEPETAIRAARMAAAPGVDAMDAGNPPEWLVKAIESAHDFQSGNK
jgi:hypothetical protein